MFVNIRCRIYSLYKFHLASHFQVFACLFAFGVVVFALFLQSFRISIGKSFSDEQPSVLIFVDGVLSHRPDVACRRNRQSLQEKYEAPFMVRLRCDFIEFDHL